MNAEKNKKIKKSGHSLKFHFALIIFTILISAMFLSILGTFVLIQLGLLRALIAGPFSLIIVTFLLSLCIATALAYYVNNHILKPIVTLSNASKNVAKGDFSVRIHKSTHIEELNTTFDNFNNMVSELSSIETLRDDFVANVSHEFKTPLSAIEGYTMLLQDETLSFEEKNEYIKKITDNTRLLSELAGNILLISKLENQNFNFQKKTFRLDEQIREAILTHEVAWSSKNHDLDIELDEIKYTGEENLLLQVWLNLIGNAVKFTPENGTITVKLTHTASEAIFTITDNGIGMDQKTKKHIFEKFYQGDTSHKSAGNGLGLALCKKIIDISSGQIFCESNLNAGSTFKVILPLIKDQ